MNVAGTFSSQQTDLEIYCFSYRHPWNSSPDQGTSFTTKLEIPLIQTLIHWKEREKKEERNRRGTSSSCGNILLAIPRVKQANHHPNSLNFIPNKPASHTARAKKATKTNRSSNRTRNLFPPPQFRGKRFTTHLVNVGLKRRGEEWRGHGERCGNDSDSRASLPRPSSRAIPTQSPKSHRRSSGEAATVPRSETKSSAEEIGLRDFEVAERRKRLSGVFHLGFASLFPTLAPGREGHFCHSRWLSARHLRCTRRLDHDVAPHHWFRFAAWTWSGFRDFGPIGMRIWAFLMGRHSTRPSLLVKWG